MRGQKEAHYHIIATVHRIHPHFNTYCCFRVRSFSKIKKNTNSSAILVSSDIGASKNMTFYKV